ncbi:MAG: hypothetical protein KKD18_00805 [Nanoarchaeota archaeon]|nr:hypothetical protein [Nanoarchaeota archaeon]MBU0976937.1 hypothetical protein [Nanoarchaeota archaeon]
MARPERHDCDYFPFYAKDGRTLHILEGKYGCKGTGFFTNVMRFLTLQEDHYFCLQDESDQMYFFSKCHCDIESGMDMLNIMSKTRKIHTLLWVSYKVIVSQDLLNSLTDAYRNRKNDIITIDQILVSYENNTQESVVSDVRNTQEPVVSDADNTQRKGKEIKGKERGGENKKFIPPSLDEVKRYCQERNNNINPQTFIDHYTSNGWMVGKNKMKDWRAAVRTWEQRRKEENPDDSDKDIMCRECGKRPWTNNGLCKICSKEKMSGSH